MLLDPVDENKKEKNKDLAISGRTEHRAAQPWQLSTLRCLANQTSAIDNAHSANANCAIKALFYTVPLVLEAIAKFPVPNRL